MSRGFLYLTIILLISCGKGNNTGKIAFSTTDQDSIMNLHDHEELNLFITPTGHITTSILVNGKPCLFMIDTGAGATVIDRTKQDRFGLKLIHSSDYAAGIGSVSALAGTEAMMTINGHNIQVDSLYLMDISFVNAELKKHQGRKVDGLLGSDFLKKHHAIIDYGKKKLIFPTLFQQ
ncbi:MAG: clan AA aspartic protease [Prevotella sp.]|nr:clan AA aspartic protease [Prevotella sp.]MBQ9223645.1 clan AA aspartic protease [Prevotella sp.]